MNRKSKNHSVPFRGGAGKYPETFSDRLDEKTASQNSKHDKSPTEINFAAPS